MRGRHGLAGRDMPAYVSHPQTGGEKTRWWEENRQLSCMNFYLGCQEEEENGLCRRLPQEGGAREKDASLPMKVKMVLEEERTCLWEEKS